MAASLAVAPPAHAWIIMCSVLAMQVSSLPIHVTLPHTSPPALRAARAAAGSAGRQRRLARAALGLAHQARCTADWWEGRVRMSSGSRQPRASRRTDTHLLELNPQCW
jgi:hypothetical protein